MNAKQAKQIPLDSILHCLGHEPVWEVRGELWYYSPFRCEKDPSFKIKTAKNIWFDFGHGKGGNVLDFIRTYYHISSVSTALAQLENLIGSPAFIRRPIASPYAATETPQQKTSPQIEKIQPLQNRALIQYLMQRGISKQTASPYVVEIYYSLYGKKYFALAFPSKSGGYELRNPYFKGAIGKKDISLLWNKKATGREDGATPQAAITVFEGFIDFLSALTFFQVAEPKTPVIVLNSVSLKERSTQTILEMGFGKVYLYLDQDDSGKQVLAHFRQHLPGIALLDKSNLYQGYKDFNEFLVSTKALRTSDGSNKTLSSFSFH